MVVLHLSDLHFGYEKNDTAKAQREIALAGVIETVATVDAAWRPSVVCISGDLAWRGHLTDYEEVEKWVSQLLGTLGLTWADIIACVGNHDLDRDHAKYLARPSASGEADALFEVPMNPTLCGPFASFAAFCERVGICPLTIGETSSWLFGTITKGPLRFIVLNSAWFSRDDHDHERLWLGLPLLDVLATKGQFAKSPTKRNYDTIDIALFHHPPEDLHPSERNAEHSRADTYNYLGERVDIILTGHQHQSRLLEPLRRGNGAQHFEAGATYASIGYKNSFRLMRLDSAARTVEVLGFSFDPASREWHKSDVKGYSLPARTVSAAPPTSDIDEIGTWRLFLNKSLLSDNELETLIRRLKQMTGDITLDVVDEGGQR